MSEEDLLIFAVEVLSKYNIAANVFVRFFRLIAAMCFSEINF